MAKELTEVQVKELDELMERAAKAAKIMDELGISATRRVKGLGARQREQLLEALTK